MSFLKRPLPPLPSFGRTKKRKKKKSARRRAHARGPRKVLVEKFVEFTMPKGAELGELKRWGSRRKVRGNPPAWVSNEEAWERAKKLVREHGWHRYAHPWAAVAHVYGRLVHRQ